ncbi:MAG: sensor histidine kinase [Nocardioides sp.]
MDDVFLPAPAYAPLDMGTSASPQRLSGILAGVGGLEAALHIAFVVLTVASSVRYVGGHGWTDRTPWVLVGAVLLLLLYAAHRRFSRNGAAWCAVVVAVWMALTLAAPSFSWCAVPLAFVALRVLSFTAARVVVAIVVGTVVVAWSRMLDEVDPTIVLGPVCVAVLAVMAYRALEAESVLRQKLLDELRDAQGELAEAQLRAGVQGERARLSRELHDSVAQELSSINLLLLAAERDWEPRPLAAREHLVQAAHVARDGLEDVRRVVRDLAPSRLDGERPEDLAEALRTAGARAVAQSTLAVEVRVEGRPVPVSAERATALVRTARGAVANVVEHAATATLVTITLTYQDDAVRLDVVDDGRGFDPLFVQDRLGRGHGLSGIRRRAAALGGSVVLESAPGEGTALAVSLPVR